MTSPSPRRCRAAGPRKRIRRALLAVILCAASLPTYLAAQTPDEIRRMLPPDILEKHKELERLLGGMAEKDKAMLDRVRAALRRAAGPSAGWRSTLERIRVDVPVLDVWDLESRAMAFARRGPGGDKPVTITQLMSFAVHDNAYLAARRMGTHLSGLPANHPKDMLLGVEAQNIEWHAMAWIAAHEIAHHRLNHTAREPATLAESRKWELDADRLGFEMLNQAGFSLYLLAWYFETMSKLEGLRRAYGLDRTREASARHPLWRRRYAQLRSALHSLPRPRENWLVMSSFKRYEKGAPLVKWTYLLPDAADALALVTITLVSTGAKKPHMIPGVGGVERFPDGRAVVYLRGSNERIVCRMENRFAPVTQTQCDFFLGARRIRRAAKFYRDSFAGVFAGASKGEMQRLFNLGGTAAPRSILEQTVADSALRARAVRLLESQHRTRQQLFLRFARGDISEAEFSGGISRLERDGPARMRALLGPARYAAYERRTKQYYEEEIRRATGN